MTSLPLAAQDSTAVAADLGLDSLLNTPVSTAAKYSQTVRQVAGSVTIISAEDIRRFGYRTLDEVLQSAAGFYLTYNRQYKYIGVRGFGRSNDHNNRILLLLDGHTINEGLTGSSQFGAAMILDPHVIKRVEILRGPASALYGTGALFAVVNVITLSGNELGVRADVSGGTAGYRQTSISAGTNLGRAELTVSGTWDQRDGADLYYPEFDDPATDDGIAHALDWEKRMGVFATVRLGPWSLRGRYGHRDKGVPTAAYGQVFNDPRSRTIDASGFVELQYEKELSAVHHVSVRTFLDDYTIEADLITPGPVQNLLARNRIVGGEAAFRWDAMASSRLTMGLEYRHNTTATFRISSPGTTFKLVDSPYSVLSLFLQEHLQVRSNLSLLAGVRHDVNSLTSPATTPRVALIYDPWLSTTFKAMYGQAFRAATPLEDGSRLAGRTAHLLPERMQMAEVIWIQRLNSSLALSGSLYEYRVTDLIDEASDSTNPLAYHNNARVEARGLELTLDARPSVATRGYLSFTRQHAVDDAGINQGELLINSPEQMVKAGFALALASRFSIASDWRAESSRITHAGNRTSVSLVGDLNLAARLFGATEMSLRITNLGDTKYAHPGGVELRQDVIQQDGRALEFRLATRL